jgi:hypothetical protein
MADVPTLDLNTAFAALQKALEAHVASNAVQVGGEKTLEELIESHRRLEEDLQRQGQTVDQLLARVCKLEAK